MQLDQQEAERIFELPNSWRDKGRQEGKSEEKRSIALAMLKEGASIEFIERLPSLLVKRLRSYKRTFNIR